MVIHLLRRADHHDLSKLESPEVEAFAAAPDLAELTYASPEYEASKRSLAKALEHHYARNDHHPQHHKDGVNDMDLLQLLEMYVDWQASSERQHDGNILKSIESGGNHYGMSAQLIRIFENTARHYGAVDV